MTKAPATSDGDDFRSVVSAQDPVAGDLPLTHISDGLAFRQIMRDGDLKPEPCRDFDQEPILYTFYGRPAYRVNSQQLSSAIISYAPVCFILRPGSVSRPRRVYPFDSGGFNGERFSEAMHRKMLRDDFALEPDPDTPRRLIGLFFGDKDRYYRNEPREQVDLPGLAFEAASYHTLITSRHENAFDERISAVEVQCDVPLKLAEAVEAVVLPDRFATPAVLQRFEDLRITPLIYDYIARLRPEAYTSDLYRLVRDYYRRQGYL